MTFLLQLKQDGIGKSKPGRQTTARGPQPARKAIPSGPQSHFVSNEKIAYLRKT